MCLVELKLSSSHGAQKADHVTYMHSVDPLEKNQIQHQIEVTFLMKKFHIYSPTHSIISPSSFFLFTQQSVQLRAFHKFAPTHL